MKELTLADSTKELAPLCQDAIALLRELIATPSFSREEDATAGLLVSFFAERRIPVNRIGNNICVHNLHFDPAKPTLLLNSHHDTVKPNPGYTKDPFAPLESDGRLYGLGSNDAGGCLVSLIACFLNFYRTEKMKYNLLLAASAEEEISGSNGIEKVLQHYPGIDCGIVGEPTQMSMAVAEKGLLVLDCISHGKAGHAAREEGDNAIYHALRDIMILKEHRFPKVSNLLGPVKLSVTSILTDNKAHNVVPAVCRFIADVRVTDAYTHEELLEEIRSLVSSEVTPRSLRMRSSSIPMDHPLVTAGLSCGLSSYGSPTTSDKALMPFPTLKIGPGDSARSHTADEFIYLKEIEEGISLYIQLLNNIL